MVVRRSTSPDEIQSIRDLYRYAIADLHLDRFQVRFLNDMNRLSYWPGVYFSDKQLAKIQEIKDTVHFDQQHVPLPPIDLDGVEENDDPDGWPIVRNPAEQFEDDELLDRLTEEGQGTTNED